ncbi:MAG TPA: SRPBCC family protein [Polyangiaceae bacterium]|jgi:hypothetical protein
MRVAFFLPAMLACASAPQVRVARPVVPSPPQTRVVTGLEDATDVVKIYEHDTVDPDNDMPTVGGYVRVHAPLSVAYAVATRFGDYQDLNPEYIEQSTVVDRQPDLDVTDLYLKVPTVIHDYVWAVVRFRPVRKDAGGYAYRGDEVRGNLDDLRIFWRIVPAGADTIAQFEFLADPHLPLPRAWILPELREGVRIILNRYRQKTEAAAVTSR